MQEQELGATSEDRLPKAIPGGETLTTAQRRSIDRSADVPGWGSDADPATRPGVPRDKAPAIGGEHLYIDVEEQLPPHRIHKSTEHARLTPVYGTSCPPRGLSGRMRDLAYRFSEGRLVRWVALLAADRVDMVEGLVTDLAGMRPPNVVREMGLRSEWRYNRKRVLTIAAATGIALGLWLVSRRVRRGRR